MIDWSKEIADKNYCGYCSGEIGHSSCNGNCFTKQHMDTSKYKMDHAKSEIAKIPGLIKAIEERKDDFNNEIFILLNPQEK